MKIIRSLRLAVLPPVLTVFSCLSVVSGPAVETWLTGENGRHRLSPGAQLTLAAGLPLHESVIRVNDAIIHQRMEGFGAALTDASAWLMHARLSPGQRHQLLQKLFSAGQGIGLSMIRLPIGASDFAVKPHTYDDLSPGESDPALEQFSVAYDEAYIIPILKQIKTIQPRLRIIASPWSPPAWMKIPRRINGGRLNPDYEEVYARYLLRFVQAYRQHGINIDFITVQNEPFYQTTDYPSMKMPVAQQVRIIELLGALLRQHQLSTKILAWDHNWDQVAVVKSIMRDPRVSSYIRGSAWHGYAGLASAQSEIHRLFPGKEIYFTEITGTKAYRNFSHNLNWSMHHVLIGASRHWANGILYWNVLLDDAHGPTIARPTRDPNVLLRGVVQWKRRKKTLYYEVEYFALGHMSRFVKPGARRIHSQTWEGGEPVRNMEPATALAYPESVAFINPDGSKVLVVLNPGWERPVSFSVSWRNRDSATATPGFESRSFSYTLAPESVVTFVWQ